MPKKQRMKTIKKTDIVEALISNGFEAEQGKSSHKKYICTSLPYLFSPMPENTVISENVYKNAINVLLLKEIITDTPLITKKMTDAIISDLNVRRKRGNIASLFGPDMTQKIGMENLESFVKEEQQKYKQKQQNQPSNSPKKYSKLKPLFGLKKKKRSLDRTK